MTTFGGVSLPFVFGGGGGGGVIDVTVSNSGTTGIFMFGGWMFPINGTNAFDRGTNSAATRDDLGDNYIFSDSYRPVDPPDYTMQTIFTSKTENWTANNNIFGQSRGCVNISNGCRIEKGVGVVDTFQCVIQIKINTSLIGSNTCPGGGVPSAGPTVYDRSFTLNVAWTG